MVRMRIFKLVSGKGWAIMITHYAREDGVTRRFGKTYVRNTAREIERLATEYASVYLGLLKPMTFKQLAMGVQN
jgi:hypothetical protein